MPGLSRTCKSSGFVNAPADITTKNSYLCGILLYHDADAGVTIHDGKGAVLAYLNIVVATEGKTKYVPFPYPVRAVEGITVFGMTAGAQCILYYQEY